MPIIYSKVTSEPALEPISLTEAKLDLKVDDTTDNSLIDILRQVSRETVEKRTNRSLITQTRVAKLDYFPNCSTILLPNGPVQSVTSIKYYAVDGDPLITLDSSEYWVDTSSDIARIVVKDSWPSTEDMPNAVEITYICGYGSVATNVPSPLRKACFMILAHLYENRQAVVMSGSPTAVVEVPLGAEYLMSNYILEQVVTY